MPCRSEMILLDLKQCEQRKTLLTNNNLMKAVWHFPTEAASAMCSIFVPGLDLADMYTLLWLSLELKHSTSGFWSVRDTS